jgi:hypothetical protein
MCQGTDFLRMSTPSLCQVLTPTCWLYVTRDRERERARARESEREREGERARA